MTLTATAHPGGTPGIQQVLPKVKCEAHKCQMRLHIGLFFDGTGNNRYEHEPIFRDSNVARLFRAYNEDTNTGYFRIYIPGIGTRFPEIGEVQPLNVRGMGMGMGGEGRINYGLLSVLNAVHRAITGGKLQISDATIQALCRNPPAVSMATAGYRDSPTTTQMMLKYPADREALADVGMADKGGLSAVWPSGSGHRKAFLSQQVSLLAAKIKETDKPKVVEIFFDVFGFSRGAAQARTFSNWLLELFSGNQFCGVPASIRFLGLFDSVASVGAPRPAPGLGRWAAGHLDWADAANLRVSARVKNCHHYMAIHENRAGFPVEQLAVGGRPLPAQFKEYGYPGMHSDVGGGYSPVDQGRGPNHRDNEKLAQIPLVDMYKAAVAAAVPLDKNLAKNADRSPSFDISPELAQASAEFFAATGREARPLREWLKPYLAWRYQVRQHYLQLPACKRALKDSGDLRDSNALLQEDVEVLEKLNIEASYFEAAINGFYKATTAGKVLSQFGVGPERTRAEARLKELEPEALDIYRYCRAAAKTPAALAVLFADFCHDSISGFKPGDFRIKNVAGHTDGELWGDADWQLVRSAGRAIGNIDFYPGTWEPTGYFRYRRYYQGSDTELAQHTGGQKMMVG